MLATMYAFSNTIWCNQVPKEKIWRTDMEINMVSPTLNYRLKSMNETESKFTIMK